MTRESGLIAFVDALSPWPFRVRVLKLEGEGRALPSEGRFEDEASMREWFAGPKRVTFSARIAAA